MLFSSINKTQMSPELAKNFIDLFPFGKLQSIDENQKIQTSPIVCLCTSKNNSLILTAHLASSNLHLNSRPKKVTVQFETPHTYVSPENIQSQKVLPTWSYAWLELVGTTKYIDDKKEISKHLSDLYTHLEKSEERFINFSDSYQNKLLNELILVEIEILSQDSVIKMGNDKDESYKKDLLDIYAQRITNDRERKFLTQLSQL